MTINEVFEMTREQRDALTDEQLVHLSYAINYYSPMDSAQWTSWWERDLAINQELKARLSAIETARRATQRCNAQPVRMVLCDCGHTVPASLVMNASLGTSCPGCYDRMSH